MIPTRYIALLVFLTLALVLPAGCAASPTLGSQTPTVTTPAPASTTPASTTPGPTAPSSPVTLVPTTLMIIEPVANSVQINGDVTVVVQVTGFNLIDKTGQPNVPGNGHLIYYLDVNAPTTPGQAAFTAPGTYAVSSNTSFLWLDLIDGVYTISVELVNNDNTPLNPPAVAKATFSVFTG
jgi:hypothetical protein